VGFVAHHQIPVGVGQLRLNILIPAQLVQTADRQGIFGEPVAGTSGFKLIVGEDFERKLPAAVVEYGLVKQEWNRE
jgi:hypothetical protein